MLWGFLDAPYHLQCPEGTGADTQMTCTERYKNLNREVSGKLIPIESKAPVDQVQTPTSKFPKQELRRQSIRQRVASKPAPNVVRKRTLVAYAPPKRRGCLNRQKSTVSVREQT